jgi:predicted Zn-ribbon and HTH transcriptional regulator
VAPTNDRCQKCGRSFTKIKVATTLRILVSLFAMVVLFFAFIELTDGEKIFEGITLGSTNTIFAAIVVIILVNAAGLQTVKEEKKKYGVNGTMLCLACQDKVKVEAEQAHVAAQTEAERWKAELKALLDSDPTLLTIVQEWRAANKGAVPSRGAVAELKGAINFERAGNFEGAAKIYEEQKLWSLAGKVREKSRVQTVKHVTVDMNQLIEQISTRGLAVPYKCQNCGASITIDKNSSASGLKFCSYCGTTYNVEDMSKIVQEALEY